MDQDLPEIRWDGRKLCEVRGQKAESGGGEIRTRLGFRGFDDVTELSI